MYVLITKRSKDQKAKNDALRECLLRLRKHSVHGISKLAMLSIGCISVYTPADQEQMYLTSSSRRNTLVSAGIDSVSSVALFKRIASTRASGGHISWTDQTVIEHMDEEWIEAWEVCFAKWSGMEFE